MPELMKASAMLLISLSVQMSAQEGGDEMVSDGEAARLCRHNQCCTNETANVVSAPEKGGHKAKEGAECEIGRWH